MRDHEIARLVNEVTNIAKVHHDKGCLRELMSRAVNNHLNCKSVERITTIDLPKATKRCEFKLGYNGYTFEYDTAKELGELVLSSGCKMPNPYEPMHTEFDDYDEAICSAK